MAHIINVVKKEENPELFTVQNITINSMLHAKNLSAKAKDISFLSVGFFDNDPVIPSEFKQLPSLKNDTLRARVSQNRKLPFIKDILETAMNNSEADYFIYSNTDIAVMPFFYDTIFNYINKGYDGLVINRRRIKDRFIQEEYLEAMYAEVGQSHPGYDCFVIKRTVLKKFILKNLSVGIPPLGNDLFHNVFTFAENPVLFSEKHLTFHIGTTIIKDWGEPEIQKHNYKEYKALLNELYPLMDADKFPGAELGFFARHFKWLMNFMFSYPLMFKLDMKRGFKRKKIEKGSSVKTQPYVEWLIRKSGFKDP